MYVFPCGACLSIFNYSSSFSIGLDPAGREALDIVVMNGSATLLIDRKMAQFGAGPEQEGINNIKIIL